MLKDKNAKLLEKLEEVIKKYSRNEKLRDIITEEFRNRNMKASQAINILNEKIKLSTLDIDTPKDLILLFVFAFSMYRALLTLKEDNADVIINLEDFRPENYFTPIEIESLSDYKLEKEEQLDDDIIFPNMTEIAPDFYLGDITAQYLSKLDAGNEFIYNFKTQRDPIIDIYGHKRIHLIKNSVEEMVNGLLSGEQFPTTIVVNVLRDGNDYLKYNEKTRELTVRGTKNLVDGMHRKVATVIAVEKNPDLDFRWLFVVTNYSEIKAQKYMVEINKQQKMKQEHIKSMDTSKIGNIIVDAIKDIETSEFADKIKDNYRELEFGGLTKKSTLSVAIEENYKDMLDNKLYVKNIARHIANVMDYIIGLRVESFIANPKKTKETSYINHNNMFAGYVALSRELYEVDNWEEKLEKVIDNIDFSINNSFWNDIKLTDSEMSKSTRNKLYKYFRSQL